MEPFKSKEGRSEWLPGFSIFPWARLLCLGTVALLCLGTLIAILLRLLGESQEDFWPLARENSTAHAASLLPSTGFTPNFLLGYLPVEIVSQERTIIIFNGFKPFDIYIVPRRPYKKTGVNEMSVEGVSWTYDANNGSIFLDRDPQNTSVASRFLYPGLVQMKDPVTRAVKSFTTTFVFQILVDTSVQSTRAGPGLAFIIVPDNVTVGVPHDYMGLLTLNNYSSDDRTLGVELDTYMNPEFGDPNDNHIGIDLASMNSSYTSLPPLPLTTTNKDHLLQVWIDYFQHDSRMDIYITQYGDGKPSRPQGSKTELDLSFIEEYMYVGFSATAGRSNVHVCSWSFTTDGGDAPPILIARDAPPSRSPFPGANRPMASQNKSRHDHVAAPDSGASSSQSLPPRGIQAPAQAGLQAKGQNVAKFILGVIVGILIAIVTVSICYWIIMPIFTKPLLFFLAHAAGEDETTKNFTEWLYTEIKSTWRCKLNLITVFFDRRCLPMAEDFPKEIKRALDETRVGVVIITPEFFERKWPMTELLSFVDSKMRNPARVRILPLFYKLKADEVRAKLRQAYWDEKWRQMSTERHPMDVEKCREAVVTLCYHHGIEYNSSSRGHDSKYIEEILKEVINISDQMR